MLARGLSYLTPATLAVAAWVGQRAARGLATLRGELASPLGPHRDELLLACSLGSLVCALVLGVALAKGPGHRTRSPLHALTLAVVALLWIAGYQWFGQPYHRLAVELSIGLAAGAYGGFVGLLSLWPGPTPRFAQKAALALIASVVGLELAFTAVAAVRPTPVLATASLPPRGTLESYRLEPGTYRLGMAVNAHGFYDGEFLPPERRKRPMVAAIGDSFTTGVVPHPMLFHSVVEQRLGGVDVYAYGVPAVGMREYRALLVREVLPLRPDAVVLQFFAGNDLLGLLDPVETDAGLRRILDGERLLVRVAASRIAALHAERSAGALTDEITGVTEPRVVALDELARKLPWITDHRLEPGSWSVEKYDAIVRPRVQQICLPHRPLLEELCRQLLELRDLCGDVPFAVVLHPSEFQVEDGLWNRVTRTLPPAQRQGLVRDRLQRELGPWLESQGIPHLDLLPVFLAEPRLEDGDRHLYLLRDTHYNGRGNRVAGEAMAELTAALLGRPAGAGAVEASASTVSRPSRPSTGS